MGANLEVLKRGQNVFTTNCTKCHEQIMPKEGSLDSWHAKYPAMAWDEELTQEDADAVIEYINASR